MFVMREGKEKIEKKNKKLYNVCKDALCFFMFYISADRIL